MVRLAKPSGIAESSSAAQRLTRLSLPDCFFGLHHEILLDVVPATSLLIYQKSQDIRDDLRFRSYWTIVSTLSQTKCRVRQ